MNRIHSNKSQFLFEMFLIFIQFLRNVSETIRSFKRGGGGGGGLIETQIYSSVVVLYVSEIWASCTSGFLLSSALILVSHHTARCSTRSWCGKCCPEGSDWNLSLICVKLHHPRQRPGQQRAAGSLIRTKIRWFCSLWSGSGSHQHFCHRLCSHLRIMSVSSGNLESFRVWFSIFSWFFFHDGKKSFICDL